MYPPRGSVARSSRLGPTQVNVDVAPTGSTMVTGLPQAFMVTAVCPPRPSVTYVVAAAKSYERVVPPQYPRHASVGVRLPTVVPFAGDSRTGVTGSCTGTLPRVWNVHVSYQTVAPPGIVARTRQ